MSKKDRVRDRDRDSEDSVSSDDLLNAILEISKEDRPGSIRVFGRVYKVAFIPQHLGFHDCGQTIHENCSILIRENQLPVEEADTLLHEVVHTIDYVMDLSLTEHQVRALATGLLGTFRDNPDFAKYILNSV